MQKTLTPRARVLAALAHQQPDHVPRDLGGCMTVGINLDQWLDISVSFMEIVLGGSYVR